MEQDHLFFTLLEADDSRDHTGDKAVFKERFDQLALEVQKLDAEMAQEADEQKEPDALVAAVQEQQQMAMMGKQGQADEELGDDEQGECYEEEEECMPDEKEEDYMPEDEEEECMPDEEEECIPGDKEEVFTPVDEQLMPDEEAEEEECMPDGEDEEEEDCIDIFNDSENQ